MASRVSGVANSVQSSSSSEVVEFVRPSVRPAGFITRRGIRTDADGRTAGLIKSLLSWPCPGAAGRSVGNKGKRENEAGNVTRRH